MGTCGFLVGGSSGRDGGNNAHINVDVYIVWVDETGIKFRLAGKGQESGYCGSGAFRV